LNTPTSRLPIWEYLLTLSLVLLLTACGGGGGGGASTILAFVDDWGAPIPGGTGFFAQVTGGALTAAINVSPDANGRVSVNLDPGAYTVNASYMRVAQAILINASQAITVADGDKEKVQAIELKDSSLSQGWSLFRSADYPGAIIEFLEYEQRAGQANVGSNNANNALGWARIRNNNFGDGEAAFNLALAADNANQDAFVGKAGLLLLRNSSNADLVEAITRLSSVIDAEGNYSSAPTHDHIVEVDLIVCRALAHFLQGDLANTQLNLDAARPAIASGSDAGIDLFNTLDLFLKN